jgi:hypothetical protein
MRCIATAVLGLLINGLAPLSAHAAPIIISQPSAAYQSSTTKIDISGLTLNTNVTSVSDAALTVTFGTTASSLNVRQVPVGGWGSWSSPPYSESATPRVLFKNADSLTLNLSQAVEIFGFELESDFLNNAEFTAKYFLGTNLIGTVGPLTIDKEGGARLFALNGVGETFDRIVIKGNDAFAIAQIRYAFDQIDPPSVVPEPPSAVLWSLLGIIGAVITVVQSRRTAHSQLCTTPA